MGKGQQPPTYGGQALVEGVMFGGKEHTVTAIRRKDDSIDYFHLPKEKNPTMMKLKKIPFVRGIVALIESAGIGSRHLTFSSERYDVEPGEEAKQEAEEPSKLAMVLGVAAVGVFLFYSVSLFSHLFLFSSREHCIPSLQEKRHKFYSKAYSN